MDPKPKCIVVTGRPGSGKTTLAGELSRRLYLPKICRDEIKEGYVNTFGVKHDQLPEDSNGIATEIFFETILNLLRGKVSIVIEAAFQHTVWDRVIPRIIEIARTYIIICECDPELSARRHLERGLTDPNREFYHGDKRVALFRDTGTVERGGEYIAPMYDVPTLKVATTDGYVPNLEGIIDFVKNTQ